MSETPWAIGYARVSTTKQAVEGESLLAQASLIEKDIVGQGWRLVPDGQVLQEPFTGTTDDRPVYREAIRFIKKHPGRVKYFVVRSIDRFTREGSLQYQQMKSELAGLGVELRDISRVIQPTVNSLEHLGVSYRWSRTTPSAISEVVLAEAGRHEVSSILTRLIGAEITLVRQGYHIGPADDGYLVRRIFVDGKKRCAQFPDPQRAHFYRMMFDMRADGTYSDKDIVERINALGFRTRHRNRWDATGAKLIGRRDGKPLSVKRLQAIVLRPVYCGVIAKRWTNWKPVLAQGGEALVSIETYNRANRGKRKIGLSDSRTLTMSFGVESAPVTKKREQYSSRWPYKRIAMCPVCRRPLWASASRGKSGRYFSAYHCTRGHERYSVRQVTLDAAFDAFVATLRFTDESWADFSLSVRAAYDKAVASSETAARKSEETVGQLEEQKLQMVEAFALAGSDAMRSSIERRVEAIEAQIVALREQRRAVDVQESEIDTFLEYTRRLLEHPARILGFIRNVKEQIALFRLFFEEFPTLDEIMSGTPRITPTFTVFRASEPIEDALVHRTGLNWNTIAQEMKRWQSSYWAIDALYHKMTAAQDGSSSKAA